ncbi:hypothetical protein CLAFUW4_10707 [Fulvia fulva]|uniref:Uncharacterized protein n=1 Tax=Passalora fulva TaxID=5499 RepID=A0A9Q8P8A4_PASFU|nr:uncharacterized protein CLAFUR5_05321 [Fulvia fulva]KAK4615359.1 hypothetical protein CLAFUR4_10712 [Fulvia fulva]KAK4616621.1 hypothetical protein CLAFUR0_10718 [Fulvia fulva]UJO16787.1 hypothetical protein CLAFUR5_05321 [Fulvia fulva]WPV19700.1 hypothetical protein CLAFUW4_10707 [Fulvia fulva]WPV33771.1 hypothetical protein CLAFUW7_10709 [Fulvia fulva]
MFAFTSLLDKTVLVTASILLLALIHYKTTLSRQAMAGNSSSKSYHDRIRLSVMAQMNAIYNGNTTASHPASSSSTSPTSTSPSSPATTMLPIADINSPHPDNRVNLARVMYRMSDLISHLHNHYQATMPQKDEEEADPGLQWTSRTTTEFRLWIGKARRAAQQALVIRARTQVAVQLPGFVAKKSRVLGEFPSHLEEYFGLFCSDIATSVGVKYSVVHELGFAVQLRQNFGMGGSWGEDEDDEMALSAGGNASKYAIMQMFAFPNAYWALCLAGLIEME